MPPTWSFARSTTGFLWATESMRVAERLQEREKAWHELDMLIARFGESTRRRPTTGEVLRLGELYRAAFADFILPHDHHLPPATLGHPHPLLRPAHHIIYPA